MKTNECSCRITNRLSSSRMSKHLMRRARQRGFNDKDLGLITEIGVECDDGYIVTARAVRERIGFLKAEIQQLERLSGSVLIEEGENLVTVYRPDRRRCRRFIKSTVGGSV